MPITSADVARAAGVSRATVSYVLNDAPGRTVSTETRETVLRVARDLGYQPNTLARSLKRGRSNTVLFPLPRTEMNHTLSTLIDACTAALAPRGLALVRDMSLHEDPTKQADTWAEFAPAAVLDLLLHRDDPALSQLQARGVPVLPAAIPGTEPWESTGDAFARMQRLEQVRYLASLGHRDICWLLPRTLPVDPRAEHRLLTEAHSVAAATGAELAIERVDLDEVPATVAAWRLVPRAVAAHNDMYAIAVLTALRQRDVRVPDHVAVIGADDEPLGRAVTPSITTVAADFTAFGEAVADAVEAVLAGRPATALPVPPLEVIRRDSA